MIRSHKTALDPTYKQEAYFRQAAGTARFVWNEALRMWNAAYEAGGKPKAAELKKTFNAVKYELYPWLEGIHRDAHSQPFTNLRSAWSNFFAGRSDRPSTKKKGRCRDSFYVANDRLRVHGKHVVLPIVGSVRLREELRFEGKIMSATVSRTADRWHVSIQVELPDVPLPRSADGIIAVDPGINHVATTSDGTFFDAPKPLAKNLKKLRRASRSHSRKQNGSNNKRKSAMRLARLHAGIANIRNDFLHKTTSKIANENQVVIVEGSYVAGMMRSRSVARSFADVGVGEMRRQLAYKVGLHGGAYAETDRFLASSKTCSCCGNVKKHLPRSERVYRCDVCGLVLDRDVNAARVILKEGLKSLSTPGLGGIYAYGPEGSGVDPAGDVQPCRDEVGTKPECLQAFTY